MINIHAITDGPIVQNINNSSHKSSLLISAVSKEQNIMAPYVPQLIEVEWRLYAWVD